MWGLAEIPLVAAIAFLLYRIAATDFLTQKILNRDVLLLAGLGLGWALLRIYLAPEGARGIAWFDLWMSIVVGAGLFVMGLVVWLMGKMGAGDVKLLGAAPLAIGGQHLLIFSIVLLVAVMVTVSVIRNPFLLPRPVFERYIEHLDRKRIVPFGVPIAAALLVTIAVRAFSPPM